MRWPWRAPHRQNDRQIWADLTRPEPTEPELAQMRAEAAALADAFTEPTVLLESGVRVPAWLTYGTNWE